jgi:hypothetical protein
MKLILNKKLAKDLHNIYFENVYELISQINMRNLLYIALEEPDWIVVVYKQNLLKRYRFVSRLKPNGFNNKEYSLLYDFLLKNCRNNKIEEILT